MKSGLGFLVAALGCEIEGLEQLARTGELVGTIGRLVHALQRERGICNVLLASRGQRFTEQRREQIVESLRMEAAVRQSFEHLAVQNRIGNGARLFSRIAWVLPGLGALPELRRRIGALEIDAAESTAAFVKLIAGLLAVVFEAADGATDPEISRVLVALFNFMQGKEFAGQERACGAAAFASGRNDAARQQQWLHLIDSQERCFKVFVDFSDAALVDVWRASQSSSQIAEQERMRRIACAAPAGVALDPELSPLWFDCCSQRIDAMRGSRNGWPPTCARPASRRRSRPAPNSRRTRRCC
ncbi:nitrate- and nitrite sensing domain-containing protein [Variovorax ureilyticus]|uniref:nitrate- and nitrite sensing domain-containing protein n=1 Tax=Variovorax ureilyticus TaxID=1836198 RepID=UPI003D67411E